MPGKQSAETVNVTLLCSLQCVLEHCLRLKLVPLVPSTSKQKVCVECVCVRACVCVCVCVCVCGVVDLFVEDGPLVPSTSKQKVCVCVV
jgi:hypothetical protein